MGLSERTSSIGEADSTDPSLLLDADRKVALLYALLIRARRNVWSSLYQILLTLLLILVLILGYQHILLSLSRFALAHLDKEKVEVLWAAQWPFVFAAFLYLVILLFMLRQNMRSLRMVSEFLRKAD